MHTFWEKSLNEQRERLHVSQSTHEATPARTTPSYSFHRRFPLRSAPLPAQLPLAARSEPSRQQGTVAAPEPRGTRAAPPAGPCPPPTLATQLNNGDILPAARRPALRPLPPLPAASPSCAPAARPKHCPRRRRRGKSRARLGQRRKGKEGEGKKGRTGPGAASRPHRAPPPPGSRGSRPRARRAAGAGGSRY